MPHLVLRSGGWGCEADRVSGTAPEQRILLRLSGEVSTKAKPTRRQFVTQLLRNVRDALATAGVEAGVDRHYERIVVTTAEGAAAAEALRRVFGLQSLAITEPGSASTLEEVVADGYAHFRERVADKRFAVRARHVGNAPAGSFRGRDVEVALGEKLLPHAARVDLSNPEVTARIELFEGRAYHFAENVPGEAGLPLGTGGRAVALVSGGFDSAVAAWQLHRRGVELDYVFCNLGGRSHRLGTVRVMYELASRWCYGSRPRFHAIDFADVSRELQARTEPRYWQVILKRLMMRAAETIATEMHGEAIVTGEAVGQVSSQTLVNLRTISAACELPILRPLVGMNKDEIIRAAERIGTAPLSAVVDEYCALVPRNPATRAKLAVVEREEEAMDPAVLERAIAARESFELRSIDPEDTGLPELETSEVPKEAVVVDLRSRAEYQSWHYEGALHLAWSHALEAYPSFGKDQTYVLYCEYGLKSAHLAEMMHAMGLRGLHFRGGTRALRRLGEKAGRTR